jgi:hypothetical protein
MRLSKLVMIVHLHRTSMNGEGLKPISRVRGVLLQVWGPADSWDSPLAGTRYDSIRAATRQHDSLVYRRQRWDQQKQHWNQRKRHWEQRMHRSPSPNLASDSEHPAERTTPSTGKNISSG